MGVEVKCIALRAHTRRVLSQIPVFKGYCSQVVSNLSMGFSTPALGNMDSALYWYYSGKTLPNYPLGSQSVVTSVMQSVLAISVMHAGMNSYS